MSIHTTKLQCSYHKQNLIQVLFLRVIYEKPTYGYKIIENIKKITNNQHEIKTGTAYTLLRRMEKRGLLMSVWEENKQGPNKRIYMITKKGKKQLKIWLEIIIQRKKIINKMVNFYNKHFRNKKL